MSSHPVPFEIDFAAIAALPEDQREEEYAKALTLKATLEGNPLWRYLPHEGERQWKLEHGIELTGSEQRGQKAFHEIDAPYGAFVAGNRSGKTHCGVVDDLIQTLKPEWVPPWLLPYKRWGFDDEVFVRIVGVNLGYWLDKVMLPKCRLLVPPGALWRGSFDKAYDGRNHKLQFADGSWWDFLTHDMEIDAYAGADLDRVHFDEEPPGERGKQQYEESLGRLVDRDGEVRWTLTPLLGLNFVYYELTRDGKPRDDEECVVVTGDIDHNPHISEKGRDRFLARFKKDPLKLQARKSGRWVHFAGLIYDEFRDDRHIVPERPVLRAPTPSGDDGPPLVTVYAAIDPGINKDHQMALVVAWMDADGVLEVFHTHKFADGTVEDMAKHFHGFFDRLGVRPRWTVMDPASRNRNPQTGRSIEWEFQRHGIHCMLGQNARQAGFNAVKERLRGREEHDYRPELVVQAQCDDLVEEFRDYRWKQRRGASEDAARPEPVKIKDDLLDALRYLCMSLPVAPKQAEEIPENEGSAQRALRESMKRLGKKRRQRVGGYM